MSGTVSIRVRRIGKSAAAGRMRLPQRRFPQEPLERIHLRIIGFALALPFLFLLLVLRKVLSMFGWLGIAAAVVVVGLFVGTVILVLRRRSAADKFEPAPSDVEETLPFAEIESRIGAALLTPDDLVFENNSWCTLLESAQFCEATVRQRRWGAGRRMLKAGLGMMAGLIVVVGLAAFVLNIPALIGWLSSD